MSVFLNWLLSTETGKRDNHHRSATRWCDMSGLEALVPGMRDICGAGNVITDPLELRTYECDGLTSHRCVPALVVLPGSAAEVALVVALCAGAGVPFVARG